MKRAPGFTLIELLVVIAIITILAGIMVPKIGPMIAKARMARAAAEIHNIELSLQSMLADAGKKSFTHMWRVDAADTDPSTGIFGNPVNIAAAMDVYERAFYLLLRLGRSADSDADWPTQLTLRSEVKQKLGANYMDLGNDPWGNRYQFCPGPLRHAVIPFRVFQRADPTIPGLPALDGGERSYVDIETDEPMNVGFPASKNMTIYCYSMGQNLESNQLWTYEALDPAAGLLDLSADMVGGGDDINNWDEGQSYTVHYN